MGIYLNQGNKLFADDIKRTIYIDKSEIIAKVNHNIEVTEKYIAVSRPRRFGKSMAANMLVAYYSRGCDSKELFENLQISRNESFEKHLNKYNVIHLDMNQYGNLSVEETITKIEKILRKELNRENPNIDWLDDSDVMIMLQEVFDETGIPFIFIIDEWDMFMRKKGYTEEDQENYLDFLKRLLKEKAYVALCYMTGILPIKKYGEQSALNMFDEYSMENQKDLSVFTGFTEQEVAELCKQYGMDLNEVKKWYDGYHVNGLDIYNPRSVVMSMTDHSYDNYWTRTETYESLKKYIQMNFDGSREKIVQMISGEKIAVNVYKFKNDMTTLNSSDDVFTLLIHLGYLTYDAATKLCWIPNHEVEQEFINCFEDGGWEPVMDAIHQSEKCLQATLDGEAETVAEIVQFIHEKNTSIIKYNDENSLSCVVTLSYYTAKNQYITVRELPTGKGYADIAFIPRKNVNLPAIVVELKKEQSPEIALKQIREKNYFDSLKEYSGEVILVGINYSTNNKNHTCKIEKIVK